MYVWAVVKLVADLERRYAPTFGAYQWAVIYESEAALIDYVEGDEYPRVGELLHAGTYIPRLLFASSESQVWH
jgi:hypothetical protein